MRWHWRILNIDPVIIRLLLIVLIFLGFSGIIAYIVAAFIIPKNPNVTTKYPNPTYYNKSSNKDSNSETTARATLEKTED